MITEKMVLPRDVQLLPVAALPTATRQRLDAQPTDVTVSRPATRVPALLIDAESAALLEHFRRPSRIVDAVVGHSRTRDADAGTVLDEAFPVLGRLLDAGILVPDGSALAAPLTATLEVGQTWQGLEIVRVVQVLADTEVYEARADDGSRLALKRLRPGAPAWVRASIRREASILSLLEGSVAPALVDTGAGDGAYVAVAWIEGLPIVDRAAALRQLPSAARSRALLALASEAVDAFRRLHARGVLHGDVHPGNLLVTADGAVRVLDFGLARRPGTDQAEAAARGAVPYFLEPEHALALAAGTSPPPSSAAGEQYALAALLHGLFTGLPYLPFAADKEGVWQQVVAEAPAAFTERGAPPWPALEAVLARALAKEPGARFADLAAFGEALATVQAPADPMPTGSPRRLRTDERPWYDPERPLAAPAASFNCGAAGVAFGVLRLAIARDDADLLALADRWITRARQRVARGEGLARTIGAQPPRLPRRASVWNGEAGVHVVEAMVAAAFDDEPRHGRALADVAATLDVTAPATDHEVGRSTLDVTDGVAGALVATSLLRAEGVTAAASPLDVVGRQLAERLAAWLATESEISAPGGCPLIGAAHGWAGYLYALLLWAEVSGAEPPPAIEDRLEQLARQAEDDGRGIRFKASLATRNADVPRLYWSGWCNGSAGLVPLWLLAHRRYGGDRWATMAERSAWHAWESREATGSLCCGLVGRAYALGSLHRATGDPRWARRARTLADRAATGTWPQPHYVHSLYQGRLGLDVLEAELEHPHSIGLPFYELSP